MPLVTLCSMVLADKKEYIEEWMCTNFQVLKNGDDASVSVQKMITSNLILIH